MGNVLLTYFTIWTNPFWDYVKNDDNEKLYYGERDPITGILLPQQRKSREPISKLCYSVDEVADRLGICKSIIWEQVRVGNLKAIKLNKRVLIRDVDLQEFVDNLPDYMSQAS